MNKTELKKILKPLIKECIKECIFEEGVLSNIVTEVAQGLSNQKVVVEGLTVESSRKTPPPKQDLEKRAAEMEAQRQERIKRLNESAGFENMDLFNGVGEIPPEQKSGANPLSSYSPKDSGVDIAGIMKLANNNWRKLANNG
jgi:hypothetical protein